MTMAFLVSYGTLWALAAFVALAILVLARRVDRLNAQLPIPPTAKRDPGPPLGEKMPASELVDVDGEPLSVGGPLPKYQLVVFISPLSPSSAQLLPALGVIERTLRRDLDVVLVGVGASKEAAVELTRKHGVETLPLVMDAEFANSWNIAGASYTVLLDRAGTAKGKGPANTIEDVENLLRAEGLGVRTVDDLSVARVNPARWIRRG